MEITEHRALEQMLREARTEGGQQEKIVVISAVLRTLCQKQGLTLEEAMVLLEIPRKERKTYRKIFAAKEIQKQARMEK